ncbi:hypothetical protein [Bacillus sp. AK128]
MRKKYWAILTISIFIIFYLVMLYFNSSKVARNYVSEHNYLILWSHGDIHTFTLNQTNLLEMPQNYIWSLQEKSPIPYLGKEITTEQFFGFHPRYGLRYLNVMKVNQMFIGGYSVEYRLLPSNGSPESITGEEVSNGRLYKWKNNIELELSKLD